MNPWAVNFVYGLPDNKRWKLGFILFDYISESVARAIVESNLVFDRRNFLGDFYKYDGLFFSLYEVSASKKALIFIDRYSGSSHKEQYSYTYISPISGELCFHATWELWGEREFCFTSEGLIKEYLFIQDYARSFLFDF